MQNLREVSIVISREKILHETKEVDMYILF